jgi:hypothetical protein
MDRRTRDGDGCVLCAEMGITETQRRILKGKGVGRRSTGEILKDLIRRIERHGGRFELTIPW